MKEPALDPDLVRLFRQDDAPPSTNFLERIDARIDRHARRIRLWAAVGMVTALAAIAVSVSTLATFADGIVNSIDPAAGDFAAVMTSSAAVGSALLALFLAVPWLWFRTLKSLSGDGAPK
jgi:hypothetical protein